MSKIGIHQSARSRRLLPLWPVPVFVFHSSCDMKAVRVRWKDAVVFAVTVTVVTSSVLC